MSAPESALAACDATCQAQFLAEHNAVRAKLNNGQMPAPGGLFQPTAAPALEPLTWSTTRAANAQAWADACNFGHSPAQNYGENIAANAFVPLTPAGSVAGWSAESSDYFYAVIGSPLNNHGKDILHYTQLVWANTTSVGCGIATCTTGAPQGFPPTWNFAVCQYSPAGNFGGQFPYVAGVAQPPIPGGPLDVDANGQYEPLADGLIILRYLFSITGQGLINNALGAKAPAITPQAMLAKLNLLRLQFDIDLNGAVEPLTDGLLIVRYLFNLRGNSLISGVIGGNNPQRNTAPLIEAYLLTLRP